MKFPVFGDICEDMLWTLRDEMSHSPDTEIEFEICSGGGAIFIALAMIDVVQLAGKRMRARILGIAASAAATLALACSHVEMTSNGTMLLHSVYNIDAPDVVDDGVRVCNARQLAIIQRRDPNYTMDMLLKETFFDAESCKTHGFCDTVIDGAETARLVALVCSKLNILNGGSTMAQAKGVEVKALKAACDDEMKAADDLTAAPETGESKSAVDVMEEVVRRLEEIEHRLAVLEGEGKKADDDLDDVDSSDELAARYNRLYARLAKAPVPVSSVGTKKDSLARQKASFEAYKKAIDINDFLH